MSDEAQSEKTGREALEARAAELGVEDPAGFKNMELLEEAIANAEKEPRYSREELLANARSVTGQSAHAVAGALHGTDQKTFTKAEATALAEKFVSRKVETKKGDS